MNVLFESIVYHILISEEQRISVDDVIMEIEPSANMSLQIQEARRTYKSAIQSLHKIQQKFNLKLATMENLLAAKHRFQQARLRLKNSEQRGIEARKKLVPLARELFMPKVPPRVAIPSEPGHPLEPTVFILP